MVTGDLIDLQKKKNKIVERTVFKRNDSWVRPVNLILSNDQDRSPIASIHWKMCTHSSIAGSSPL